MSRFIFHAQTFVFLFCLVLPSFSAAQSCAQMLAAAKKSEQAGQFRDAIMKYNAAARKCGPARKAEIDGKVLAVFDRIEGLRKRAEEAEKQARQAEERALLRAEELTAQKAATDSVLAIVQAEQDKNRKIIGALDFYQGRFGLAAKKKSFKSKKTLYGFIDQLGNVTIDYQFDEAQPFESLLGFARVKKDGELYFLDTLGNLFPLAESINTLTKQTLALDLRNQGLKVLPDTLFTFTQLRILLLEQNQVQYISERFANLKDLLILDLSANQIKTLPDNFAELSKLQSFEIIGNPLDLSKISLNKFCQRAILFGLSYYWSALNKFNEDESRRLQLIEEALQIEKQMYMCDLDWINNKEAATWFYTLAWYQLLYGQFSKAEQNIRAGLKIYPNSNRLHKNLPLALLLQGRFAEAKKEYEKWHRKAYFPQRNLPTYGEVFLNDLVKFEKENIIPPHLQADVEAIKKLLEE